MPQFDFYSFSGQTFWILVTFFIFYFVIVYFYLPNFSEVLKFRQKLFKKYTENSLVKKGVSLYDLFLKNIFKK